MALRESFQFSTDYITLIIEHVRTITHLLRSIAGITYNEYALLAVLLDACKRFQAADLGDYIGLKTRAITASLLDLEDRGYIEKECDPHDRRIMLIGLRDGSIDEARSIVSTIEEHVRERFWIGLQVEEFMLFRESTSQAVDKLRGHAVPSVQDHITPTTLIHPDFYIAWRMMQEVWNAVSCKVGRLPLRECRVLLLARQVGIVSPSDAADSLLIDKAGVTLAKKKLVQMGLVTQSTLKSDDRKLIIECTRTGATLADKLHAELRKTTEGILSEGTGESLMRVNSWSMMMYRSLHLPR